MDLISILDDIVLDKLVFMVPHNEALKLAVLGKEWLLSMAGHFRKLHLTKASPLACVSHILSDARFLNELRVDGTGTDQAPDFWHSLTALEPRMRAAELRCLQLKSVPANVGAGRFLTAALRLAESCESLQRLHLQQVPLYTDGPALHSLVRVLKCRHPKLVDLAVTSACMRDGGEGGSADGGGFFVVMPPTRAGADDDPGGSAVLLAALADEDGPPVPLQRLDLSSNDLGLGGARALAGVLPRLPSLRALFLSSCGLGQDGASVLAVGLRAAGESLCELDLASNGLETAGIAALSPLPVSLQVLNLRGNWLTAGGVTTLLQLLKPLSQSLTRLDIGANRLGPEGGQLLLASLPRFPRLEALDFSENFWATTEPAAAEFGRLRDCAPELRELNLGASRLGTDLPALRLVAAGLPPGLTSLRLCGSSLTGPEMRTLLTAMPLLPRLQRLAMVQAHVDDAAVEELAKVALQVFPAIRNLNLAGNLVSKDAAERLEAALRCSPQFRQLTVKPRTRSSPVRAR